MRHYDPHSARIGQPPDWLHGASATQTVWTYTAWDPRQYKDCLPKHKESHYKDKTVVWPSDLYNGNPYVGKTASLYWEGGQDFIYIQCDAFKCGQFSPKSSQKTPHSSPVRARHGMSFVNITSDAYFASVNVVPYAESCYVGPHYNGTRLYMAKWNRHHLSKFCLSWKSHHVI